MSDQYSISEADQIFRLMECQDYYAMADVWPARQDYSRPYIPPQPPRVVSQESREAAGRRVEQWMREAAERATQYLREDDTRRYAQAICEPPADAEAQAIQVADFLRRIGI